MRPEKPAVFGEDSAGPGSLRAVMGWPPLPPHWGGPGRAPRTGTGTSGINDDTLIQLTKE